MSPLGLVPAFVFGLLPALPGCMNLSTPFDYVVNLGSVPHEPALAAGDDGKLRLVVLVHAIFRSSGALWKLEGALEGHGYLVHNLSYPSTAGYIEEHAGLLGERLDQFLAEVEAERGRAPDEIHFVGHSMGGLVIRQYLSGPGAPTPAACVFIATPHRGAVLAELRHDTCLFRLFLGDQAALQLRPGSAFYAGLKPLECDSGVIYGAPAKGDGWHDEIPGPDDGTVSAAEAQLPEATDSIRLPRGHTWIAADAEAVRQVLHFLKHRRFDRGG